MSKQRNRRASSANRVCAPGLLLVTGSLACSLHTSLHVIIWERVCDFKVNWMISLLIVLIVGGQGSSVLAPAVAVCVTQATVAPKEAAIPFAQHPLLHILCWSLSHGQASAAQPSLPYFTQPILVFSNTYCNDDNSHKPSASYVNCRNRRCVFV